MNEADETGRLEAAAENHLAHDAEAQLVTLLFEWICDDQPTWLSAETQRVLWPTEVRMSWLEARPDVRARVVSELTGVSVGAARRLALTMQTALIDAVVDNEDTPATAWADAWKPVEMGAHAPPGAVHEKVRECFPWHAPPTDERRSFLTAWLEATLSGGDGNGRSRDPILSPLMFRTSLDSKAWQEHLPLTIRATVDAARLRSEWKKRPFGAAHELATVKLPTLVEHMPLSTLQPVLEAAEKALAHRARGTDAPRPELTEEVPKA